MAAGTKNEGPTNGSTKSEGKAHANPAPPTTTRNKTADIAEIICTIADYSFAILA